MNLQIHEAPHIRHGESARGILAGTAVTLLFLYGIACFYYGPRAFVLAAVSVFAAYASDLLCTLLARRKPNPRDLSALITGLIIPLMMPASIAYSIVAVAAVFGIVAAKQPFGGVGNNVFNPAAAGFCFAAICFTEAMFAYPPAQTWLPVTGPIEAVLQNGPAFTLSLGGMPSYDLVEMLRGAYPGPMGATNILVVLACLLFLLFRGIVRWQVPVCFFATAALVILLFPRGGAELGLDSATRLRLLAYELMSGCLLFGGAFLLGDPVTTPKRGSARAVFGVLAGAVAMVFRRYGGFEVSLPFAVLLMNATVWGLDMAGEHLAQRLRGGRKHA